MTKEKSKNDRIKRYYMIIATILLLVGTGYTVYGHFAKTTTVEAIAKTVVWVEERLAIGTHDQRVDRQREALERSRNRLRFEKKQGTHTAEEVEDVVVQEERLKEVIKEREELVEEYKSKK